MLCGRLECSVCVCFYTMHDLVHSYVRSWRVFLLSLEAYSHSGHAQNTFSSFDHVVAPSLTFGDFWRLTAVHGQAQPHRQARHQSRGSHDRSCCQQTHRLPFAALRPAVLSPKLGVKKRARYNRATWCSRESKMSTSTRCVGTEYGRLHAAQSRCGAIRGRQRASVGPLVRSLLVLGYRSSFSRLVLSSVRSMGYGSWDSRSLHLRIDAML